MHPASVNVVVTTTGGTGTLTNGYTYYAAADRDEHQPDLRHDATAARA